MLNELNLTPFLQETLPFPRKAALFLSGQGSNAEAVLNDLAKAPAGYTVSVLVTDAPERSRARELAARFQIPLIEHDLKKFYQDHGAATTSLATAEGRRLRELWTDGLRRKLAEYQVDFGILAGFMTLCNIAEDLPCLNVHPGDLTVTDASGRRILAGLQYSARPKPAIHPLPAHRVSVFYAPLPIPRQSARHDPPERLRIPRE